MATTWIIAADESRARVLQVTGQEQRLTEIEDLVNPAGRAQDRELQPGSSPTSGPGSDREAQGAVEHGARTFAREVGRYLDKKEPDKEVEKLVADELPKDLAWFNARDLQRYLSDFAKGNGRAP